MKFISLFVLAAVCFASAFATLDKLPPLAEGEIDITAEREEILSVKLAEAFHRLAHEQNSINLVLLHILRVTRRANSDDLHIIVNIGPNPETCDLRLIEGLDNYQKLDIKCGIQEWHVIRDAVVPHNVQKRTLVVQTNVAEIQTADLFEERPAVAEETHLLGHTEVVKTPTHNIEVDLLESSSAVASEVVVPKGKVLVISCRSANKINVDRQDI